MNAIYLTIFVSFLLAGLGLLLFFYSAAHKDRDHFERLSLLPLEDDDRPTDQSPNSQSKGEGEEADADDR